MPEPRPVVFSDLEAARAAFALGPVAFRCTVCGRVHRSQAGGWQPCARRLESEYGLACVGDRVHVCAFLSSEIACFRPAVLGPPQALLSVIPDGLWPAVERAAREALAGWRDAAEQALAWLAERLDWEWAKPARWWEFASPAGLERARLLECALMAARFTLRYSRGTRVLAWGNGAAWMLVFADAGARFTESRGPAWPSGGLDLVSWTVASAAPVEETLVWMADVLARGGRGAPPAGRNI
ncbi:MAG: hypothetical protein AB1816_00565 [Bacillota bacterium]